MKNITSKFLVALLGVAMLVSCRTTSEDPSSSSPSSEDPSTSISVSAPTSEDPSSEDPTTEPPVSSSEDPSTSVELGNPIRLGSEADAVSNPGELVLEVGENVTVETAWTLDDVSTVKFSPEAGATYDALKLFLKTTEVGERFTLTFTLNAGVAFTGLVNDAPYDFIRGSNEVTVHFDEPAGASLVFLFSIDEEGETLKANTVSFSDFLFVARQYDSVEDIVVDGDISDWLNTRAAENTIGNKGISPATEHKSATYYATLRDDGLLLFADVYHDVYIDNSGSWFTSTNFEFFIAGGNQYWVSARLVNENITKSGKVTEAVIISEALEEEGGANYHTRVEVFVANATLPDNAVVMGEIRVGFAWKTPGDMIDGGEAAGGGLDEYWVPAGTWTNNAAQTFIDINGIHRGSQVSFEAETLDIDGDLSDWADLPTFTTNNVYLEGSDASSHKNVTFYSFLNDEGLFVAALAHHDVYIDDAADWHGNTNMEFFVNGGNQYYVAADGSVSFGSGAMQSALYESEVEGHATYVTTAELFIPKALFGDVDMVRVGFAWKTNGDTATGLGGNNGAADAWWFAAGHFPNNASEQYYVNADGIFVSDPTIVE